MRGVRDGNDIVLNSSPKVQSHLVCLERCQAASKTHKYKSAEIPDRFCSSDQLILSFARVFLHISALALAVALLVPAPRLYQQE